MPLPTETHDEDPKVPGPKAPFRFWSRTAVIGIGQGIAKMSQLLMVLIIARILDSDAVNRVTFLLSIYIAAVAFGGLNLHQSIVFFFGTLPRKALQSFSLQLMVLLGGSALITAGIVFSLDTLLASHALFTPGVFPLLALVVLLEIPTTAAPQFLLARERPDLSAAFASAATLLQVAALVVPFLLGGSVMHAVYWLLGHAFLRAVGLAFVLRWCVPRGPMAWDGGTLRRLVGFALPLGLSIVASSLNRQVDKWIVSAFDPDNFGSYAFAAVEIPFVPILPYAVGAVLATRIVAAQAGGHRERALAYFRAGAARMSWAVIPIAIGIAAAGPEIFTLAFTDQHSIATTAFTLYALILVHRVAEYGIMLRAAGDTRSLWLASAVLLGTNLLFSIPLTASLGLTGAALGTMFANGVAWYFILGRIAASTGTNRRHVLPWRSFLMALGIALVAAGAALGGAALLPEGTPLTLRLVAKGTLFVTAFLGLTGLFRGKQQLPPLPAEEEVH
ncbi:MAG: lipopolysaccharide biosynthesis protein [Myxococcales bacterium]|nr:lipopolysaccharide biosynthesis protein [Myxococcales bacterium]